MSEHWAKFITDHAEMHEDRVRKCEHSAVQRILHKTKLSGRAEEIKEEGGTNLLTFPALVTCTGFPMNLRAAAFKSKQMKKFDLDLEVRPATTPLFKLFDAMEAEVSEDIRSTLGLVFAWQGRGKFHVFHSMTMALEIAGEAIEGTHGRWWCLDGRLRYLEPLDSLVSALGAPDTW